LAVPSRLENVKNARFRIDDTAVSSVPYVTSWTQCLKFPQDSYDRRNAEVFFIGECSPKMPVANS